MTEITDQETLDALRDAEETIAELQARIDTYRQSNAELTAQGIDRELVIENLRAEYAELQFDARCALPEAQSEIVRLEAENAVLKRANEAVSAKCERLQAECDDLIRERDQILRSDDQLTRAFKAQSAELAEHADGVWLPRDEATEWQEAKTKGYPPGVTWRADPDRPDNYMLAVFRDGWQIEAEFEDDGMAHISVRPRALLDERINDKGEK